MRWNIWMPEQNRIVALEYSGVRASHDYYAGIFGFQSKADFLRWNLRTLKRGKTIALESFDAVRILIANIFCEVQKPLLASLKVWLTTHAFQCAILRVL